MRQSFLGVIGEIDSLPGCGQIAISHGVYVPISHRSKHLGTEAHKARLEEARRLGYQVILCTVDAKNSAQIAILNKFDWEFQLSFASKKTGNRVQLWAKFLD